MNILKAGNLNRIDNVKHFECDTCGCIFEADRTEYLRETDFRNGHYFICKCPTCDRDVILYPEDEVKHK